MGAIQDISHMPPPNTQKPLPLHLAASAAPNSNFFKGVQWSPDGTFLLTCNDDAVLRVFSNVLGTGPDLGEAPPPPLGIPGGEAVYDYAWFPGTAAGDPASCCFASTGRGHPVHLWDACSGALRCSYVIHDAADAPTAAHSLSFAPDGGQLAAGLDRGIHLFDTARPGHASRRLPTHARGGEGQPGIVAALAHSPFDPGWLAAGTTGGAAGLYDARAPEALCLLQGCAGAGVNALRWSADGNFLYVGSRGRGGGVACWDVRGGAVPYVIPRAPAGAAPHQRMQFDVEPAGRHLAAGGCDGAVRWYDLRDGSQADACFVAGDTINGVSIHPALPLLATASGHRRFPLCPSSSSSEEEGEGGDEPGPASDRSLDLAEAPALGLGEQGGQRERSPLGLARCSQGDDPAHGCNVLRVWLLESQPFDLYSERSGSEHGEAKM
uniref:Telomerase Cajal body protein 1 n=2 Tax=Auxenochlorella protothecoides TaxID=3075 RepID=A0A1D2AGF7_AUXPR